MQENLILVHANNKGADQTVCPRSLISAFVIHLFEIIICKLGFMQIFEYSS